ncbi:aminopeptidase P family protein [Arthrobacter sp. 260]|uniref:M24 family metallopeptidase n=1 Tax=Arthrobacter sp. 260 TaxID=2735314 RepID=UPI001E38C191|nr:aminopeptidase P family protein [Arthrobacter sp. 260]
MTGEMLVGDLTRPVPADAAFAAPTPEDCATERALKRERVLAVLDRSGRDAVLLTSTTALTWYLGGSRVHISLAGDPVAAVLVTGDGDHLVTFTNEFERLRSEELPPGLTLHQVPWHQQLHEVGRWFGPGVAPAAEAELARDLRDARRSLLPVELSRYRALNREVAAILTDVLMTVSPESTERQVTATLAERVTNIGAEPLVLLCNGSSRSTFRHPLPTAAPLGAGAMVVVCARRHGMVANATRWVRFGAATASALDAERRIALVEEDIFTATVPGARLNGIIDQLRESYERHGFGPDQWLMHHQGGPAGYAGRDPRATPVTDDEVVANQSFTWNPSAPGVKIEDTVLLGDAGIEVLSVDQRWPVERVGNLDRPTTLQL